MQYTNKHSNVVEPFCMAGLHLVAIPQINGQPSKAPRSKGWNQPISAVNPGGYSANADDFKNCHDFNFGLYHGASQTLALDLDDLKLSSKVIEETTGIPLTDWLEDDKRAEIRSSKANRGKLLFKLPLGFDGAKLRQFKHQGTVIFELRCGNCQDVIVGQHPEGGIYQFVGNPEEIPPMPDVLLDILSHWNEWKPCFDSVLGVSTIRPKIQSRKPPKDKKLPGQRNPIEEFNQTRNVESILLANVYKPVGSDRFIRPDSDSKAPGAVILRDCEDGVERVYSHGGDTLNDGYAHDAFDCFRLLECAGDFTQALNWSPEITKHNQRLFAQEKDKQKKSERHSKSGVKKPKIDELADGTELSDDDIGILQQLNKSCTHIVLGGKHIIVGQKNCQVQGSILSFEPPHEFKKRFIHEKLIGKGEKKGEKRKNRGQAWLEWPGKNYLPNGTGFYPVPDKCPPGVFNFFRGYQVKPVKGDCSVYLNHLKNIICAGDEISYTYLIGWLAHLFQKPDIKPNVAIVLKSIEGTGKGTLAEPLLQILGFHGNKTNGAYAIASRFNGTLASRLFIFADEVDLTDKHVADRLKGIISETTVNLERKGLEIEALPNYCRLIFASNHTRVLNAGMRERRYLVLEPSDEKAQDAAYFDNLWSWIKNDGAAKLLDYLLNVDISDFTPYKCPQTKSLIAEKLDNLSGINQFFYNEIMQIEPFGGKARIYAHELINDFIKWSNEDDVKVNMAAARNVTGRMMAKLNIEVCGRSDRGKGKFYDLPDRVQMVQLFANYLDIPEKELL